MCSDKDNDDELYGVICDIVRKTKKCKVSSPHGVSRNHCMNIFNTCFVKKINESMIRERDISCCKSSLNKPGDYFENKKNCESDLYKTIIMDCMFKDDYCKSQIIEYFMENGEILKEFCRKLNNEIGIPPETSQCDYYYAKSKEISLMECNKNTNKKLVPLCDLMVEILNKESINDIHDDLYNNVNDNFDNRLKK
ncbi:uncharacterized protein LOC111636249 [Centruroides sculpturatus]|uniref:uncharacterized protein LOC111636249 n=1 Tax=Centruroides sculpturatus TaxID=218467 RepID=UPI000C6D1BAE|nr:uncharacterized protein LOC111636249 [Centruroides sculpturatus]